MQIKNKQILLEKWKEGEKKHQNNSTTLSILHYNIQYFYSNKCDLLDMIMQYNPTIISLNELGTSVPIKFLKQTLFSYNIFMSNGTNTHGGAVLAIDKKLNSIPIITEHLNIIAVQVIIKNQTYTVASIYSPPEEPLPIKVMTKLQK